MEQRLGRGLGSLLPDAQASESSREIPIHSITPNPKQPRKNFDVNALEELSSSIQTHGVLQPIVVRRKGNLFEIISGERRWRACQLAEKSTIPAVIRENVTDEVMLELAMVENLQRRDLNPMERARGYAQMVEEFGMTQAVVAQRVGLKRATVANHLRLLELPEQVQTTLTHGLISTGHAKALLALADENLQIALSEQTIREDLSVRALERRVRDLLRDPKPPTAEVPDPEAPPWLLELQARIAERLATKVTIKNREGYRGQILLEYFNREDLDRLVEALAPKETV